MNYREHSKGEWHRRDDQTPTLDQLKFGAIQRIADATEKMAQRHTELIAERDQFERQYNAAQNWSEIYRARLSAAKGQITKLRKKIAAMEAK